MIDLQYIRCRAAEVYTRENLLKEVRRIEAGDSGSGLKTLQKFDVSATTTTATNTTAWHGYTLGIKLDLSRFFDRYGQRLTQQCEMTHENLQFIRDLFDNGLERLGCDLADYARQCRNVDLLDFITIEEQSGVVSTYGVFCLCVCFTLYINLDVGA